jgi:hypothetical protein
LEIVYQPTFAEGGALGPIGTAGEHDERYEHQTADQQAMPPLTISRPGRR